MNKTYEKANALKHVKASFCLSVIFVFFYFAIAVPVGFAEAVKVTIAQTNNLNGRLFAEEKSE